ncbi:MAG: DUF4365 domain-containing protein [Bacteroidetes bacterium]|nr:DUF4365 domain-containing protein [Bacteroidota bacterium]
MIDNNSKFPNFKNSDKTAENGVSIVKTIIESELKWIYRQNHLEHDFGIDGYIDIISDNGQVTGKSIAIQIKTGKHYFSKENEIGYIFRDKMSHFNYYSNLEIPILLVLVDDLQKEVYWSLFDKIKTEKAGNNWKYVIPKNQKLDSLAKSALLNCVGPVIDYTEPLKKIWEQTEKLKGKSQLILIQVPKNFITNRNFNFIIDSFKIIQRTPELILNLRNKVDISIDGYENDHRELHEIPEVVSWIKEVFTMTNCWPYFLTLEFNNGFMRLLFNVFVDLTGMENDRVLTDANKESVIAFLQRVWKMLNEYCFENGLSAKTNEEITGKIFHYFFPKSSASMPHSN